MDEIRARRLRQLKSVWRNRFVQRELQNLDLKFVIVLGAPEKNVPGKARLICCGGASGTRHGLPVRIRDIGIQLTSGSIQLDARNAEIDAAVPDFPGDFEFSAFCLPQQRQDVIAAHVEIELLE